MTPHPPRVIPHVIVTRPEHDAPGWLQGLREAGLEPLALPLIAIRPMADLSALHQAWHQWADYAAVMFVSGNAVVHFFESQQKNEQNKPVALVLRAQAAIKTRAWATGPGTVNALARAGVDASLVDAPRHDAGQFDSEALWAVVASQVHPGARVLIVRGADSAGQSELQGALQSGLQAQGGGRDWLAKRLTQAGATVDFVVAYQRCAPAFSAQQYSVAQSAAADGAIWLFSSSEAIANLVACLPGQSWAGARAVATHSRIAATAHKAGFGVVCESRPLLASVVASIESMHEQQPAKCRNP